MSPNNLNIFGRVLDPANLHNIAGLRVEAQSGDAKASAETDERGAFTITIDQSRHPNLFTGNATDVIFTFNVFDGDTLINTTQKTVPLDNIGGRFEIEIELTPNVEPGPFVVRGQVRRDGHPLSGILIAAVDKDLRSEELLGQAMTDEQGRYVITYTADQFRRAEKGSADLIVRVINAEGPPLASSRIHFNAKQIETVDLILDEQTLIGPSEYERLLNELAPILEGVQLSDLSQEDIAFLAGDSEQNAQHILYLVLAMKIGQKTDLPPEALYGFAREGLLTGATPLLTRTSQELRAALEAALRSNIIPSSLRNNLDAILERIQQLSEQRFDEPDEEGQPPITALLDTSLANVDKKKQQKFLNLFARHNGPVEDFWSSLRQNPEFNADGLIEDLQFTLQLGTLTQNHLPLVEELQQMRRQGDLNSMRDLVKLDTNAWTQLINKRIAGGAVGVPKDTPGKDDAERTANYAAALVKLIEEAFPTAMIADRVAKDDFPGKNDLVRFFANQPDFEFGETSIADHLAESAEVSLRGVEDRPALTRRLEAMQRLFPLSPRYDDTRVLLTEGLDSAYRIANIPERTFVEAYSAKFGGEGNARRIHTSAHEVQARMLHISASAYQAMRDVHLTVIGDAPESLKGIPADLTTLFGSLNLCDCGHCQSVYSPAAYLVDILHFLDTSLPNKADKSPLKVLLERRPDLEHIKLNCENTNTALPYADLVNEVLENYIAPGKPVANNTEGFSEEELSVNPQWTNEDAYKKLREAVYPFILPFDRSLDIARAYLEHMGSSRYEVMKAFRKNGDAPDLAAAAEYLKISAEEHTILTDKDFSGISSTRKEPEYYGFDPDATSLASLLEEVPEFLRRTGITYLDLTELLKTRFLNPDRTDLSKALTLEAPADEGCDLSKTKIKNLSDPALAKMHRFIRLWRKLGWSIRELDTAISALGATNIDSTLLQKLSQVKQAQDVLGVRLVQLLSLWAKIDTYLYDVENHDSLYDRLFQNKARLNTGDSVFSLKDDRTELKDATQPLGEHASSLLAALRIREGDLATLRFATGLSGDKSPLSLSNLSMLYRHKVLATTLQVNIPELLSLKTLTGIDPFSAPEQTLSFVDRVRRVQRAGFSILQLNYLYRHVSPQTGGVSPVPQSVDLLIKTLGDGLQKIARENAVVPNPDAALLRSALASILDPRDLKLMDTAVSVIDGSSSVGEEDRKSFIDLHFKPFLDPAEAKKNLVGSSALSQREDRGAYILSPLLTYLSGRSFVTQTLSDALHLESAATEFLLTVALQAQDTATDRTRHAMDDFLALGKSPVATDLSLNEARQSYERLHKSSIIINGFGITTKELAYLLAHSKDFGRFDLNGLPLEPTGFKTDLFTSWERLADLFALRDTLPQADTTLVDIFEAAQKTGTTVSKVLDALAAATGWDRKILDELNLAKGSSFTLDDFKNETKPRLLQVRVLLANRLGVSAKQLSDWATADMSSAMGPQVAAEIKNTVKARYDDEHWKTVGKTINDRLRERQKAALIAYVLTRKEIVNREITTSSHLYQHFLIDVDMSACMQTSRIKQAISSVQLFVQRCLMNLEQRDVDAASSVNPSAIDTDRWQWMKHYRVWEANRKVFLYPENWIEPELRDDKTPFFKELESELLQNELTVNTIETAFVHYLEKLDEVARLDLCGMYWQQEEESLPGKGDNIDVLHIFGRTFSQPRIYYYRRLVNGNTWTPWEKVDVDIEGDHLIPVVSNRRLYIFWPIFTQKPVPKTSYQYWEIKLAWSEYKQGKWQPKCVSPAYITSRYTASTGAYSDILIPRQSHTYKALADPLTGFLQIQVFVYDALIGQFTLDGCAGGVRVSYNSIHKYMAVPGINPPDDVNDDIGYLVVPPRSESAFMTFLETDAFGDDLTLMIGDFGDQAAPKTPIKQTPIRTLDDTPGRYSLLYPHQFHQFVLSAPFFYQDDQRAYFANPRWVFGNGKELSKPDRAMPISHKAFSIGKMASASPPSDPATIGTRADTDAGSMVEFGGALKASEMSIIGGPASSDFILKTLMIQFAPFYHKHVCNFMRVLNRHGISGLLTLSNQQLRNEIVIFLVKGGGTKTQTVFEHEYSPTDRVVRPYPQEEVDFGPDQAYSIYNWELFFHAPLLIAAKLGKDQRFEEAQRWFHYIFNPTDNSNDTRPKCYWKVLPFYNNDPQKGQIQALLAALHADEDDPDRRAVEEQIREWRAHPFNPHLIARLRLIAYQKTVVMKYIDNLIAWGDQLFNRDTIESINEATQVYILAYEMLGPRPERIRSRGTSKDQTYFDLKDSLDKFSNALVALEDRFPSSSSTTSPGASSSGLSGGLGLGLTFYFCIPQNDKLLGYWDTVEDRLFKIRHCMNIEGVVRQLPLFEPPIDPALLVRATALGVDLNSALNDLYAPTPYYRFSYMLQKALELCADLKSLGAAVLSALEKKDAEELATIRARHETNILNLVKQVKKQQLSEATAAKEGLEKARAVTCKRLAHYQDLLGLDPACPAPNTGGSATSSPGGNNLIQEETDNLASLEEAHTKQKHATNYELAAQIIHLLPDIAIDNKFTIQVTTGGSFVAGSLAAYARYLNIGAADHSYDATRASIVGGYKRRDVDWRLQRDLAARELDQIDKQIAAAEIREAIAGQEIINHNQQIENAQGIEQFLRDKYTNQELYNWMVSQISGVFFQSYQLAYGLAKRAEQAYRFELGLSDSSIIQFGYWDSLKQGLMSGERLHVALKTLETKYLDQNKREYEITRHISLVLHDPLALIALKQTGHCKFEVSESLFDADYPGHFMRRLKSVSLTIPCVIGPYTSINCTLTLLSNKIRIKGTPTDPYPEREGEDDDRFVTNFAALQSIATSHAQNDSGMFELNFRDERYLPFEGAGVISHWRLDMPKECNAFDFNTISDLVLHLKYTARDGGAALQSKALPIAKKLPSEDKPALRFFSARHEFPGEWHRLMQPTDTDDKQTLQISLAPDRFPFQFRGRSIEISQVELFLKLKDEKDPTSEIGETYFDEYKSDTPLTISLTPPGGTEGSGSLKILDGIPHVAIPVTDRVPATFTAPIKLPVKFVLTASDGDIQKIAAGLQRTVTAEGVTHHRLNSDAIEDILVVCHYSVK